MKTDSTTDKKWALSQENLSSGFPKVDIQTSLLSYRDQLEN